MTISQALLAARLGWIALGVCGAIAFLPEPSLAWYALIALPWIAGAVALWSPATVDRVRRAIELAAASPVAVVAAALFAGFLVISSLVLTVGGALLIAIWMGAILLLLGTRSEPTSFVSACVVSSVTLVLLCCVLALFEVVFQSKPLARRYGSPREVAAWNQRYDRLWERNVLGFRTSHESLAPAPGRRRVLAVGDSYTWGDKIPSSDSTWPALLESALHSSAPDAIEVLNWGRNGYTTANQAELLRRLGWQLNPDLVVVQFGVNDALPSYPNFGRENSTWLETPARVVPSRFRSGWSGRSAFVAWLERSLSALRFSGEPHLRYNELYDTSFVGFRQIVDALREIGDSASRRQVPVVLMLYPSLLQGEWTAESYPLARAYTRVADAARHAGIEVVDLVPVFAAEGGDWIRWRVTPYDGHPSVAANLVAVRALERTLRERESIRVRLFGEDP